MSKSTWIKDSTWKECKSIWTKVSGVWKEDVMVKALESTWRECMQYRLVSDAAFFSGGWQNTNIYTDAIETYGSDLVRRMVTDGLSAPRDDHAAAQAGTNALFAGGYYLTTLTDVDGYTAGGLPISASNLSTARKDLAGGNAAGLAFFAGGISSSNVKSAVVETYNGSVVRGSTTALNVARSNAMSVAIGKYVLFAGGIPASGFSAATDAYDESGVKVSSAIADLSEAKVMGSSGLLADYALFAGGLTGSGATWVIDVYDKSLIKRTDLGLPNLSAIKTSGASAVVGDYILFAGGKDVYGNLLSSVDWFHKSMTRGAPASGLSIAKDGLSGASVAGYALFAGGRDGAAGDGNALSGIDVYNESLAKSSLGTLNELSVARSNMQSLSIMV